MPSPTSFVVKNGSKIRSRMSSGIPGPSSEISMTTQSPSARVRSVIVPCSPSAAIALSRRFVHTWLSSEPRTVIRGSARS